MTKKQSKKPKKLRGRKLVAFTRRYEGRTYKEIQAETGYSEITLQGAFWRGGKWYQEYEDFADDLSKDILKKAKNRLSKHADDAAVIVASHMANPKGSQSLAAALAILDRAGLGPSKTIDLGKKDSEDVAEKMLKALENSND